MSSCKKRKLSGIDDAELSIAYNALLDLQQTLEDRGLGGQSDDVESADDQLEDQLERFLSLMTSMLEGPKSYDLSNVTLDILEEHLHVTQAVTLILKDEITERTEKSSYLGQDKLWSSSHFHDHLNWLEGLVPRTSEANVRLWIDAFFFRASAMVPPGMRMVLNEDHTIPSTAIRPTSLTTLAGQMDYSAVVAKERAAAIILDDPLMSTIRRILPTGFFVAIGKIWELRSSVGQAVAEMYGTAKLLKQNVLRGALTNGHEWIFLILNLNPDSEGGTFKRSLMMSLSISCDPSRPQVNMGKFSADQIAGILSFW
ncbi:hypothetical protein EWM64_g9278, partial [Hericium alpestre]